MDQTVLQAVLALLREFGFPVTFCLWLMWMYMKREDRVVKVLEKTQDLIEAMDRRLDEAANSVEEIHDELSGKHEGPVLLPPPKAEEGKK